MSQLVPCSGCRRHVVETEPACPFCGAAPSPIVPGTATRVARLSRAAVFAGATLVTATGCGGSKPTAEPVDNQQQQAATADAGVEPDALQPLPPTEDEIRGRGHDPSNLPMPYGAPPARRRVV
jgi:hypothetical protein